MPKRIVICSDGTWDIPNDPTPTNVVKLARAVLPTASDNTSQVVFYDWGVGTENVLARVVGGIAGVGLTRNVEDAYRFLMHNYEPGDEFSCSGSAVGRSRSEAWLGLFGTVGC